MSQRMHYPNNFLSCSYYISFDSFLGPLDNPYYNTVIHDLSDALAPWEVGASCQHSPMPLDKALSSCGLLLTTQQSLYGKCPSQYLATVKDIFHKEIVGWSVADHMRTELCLKALENAVMKHRPPKGLMHHSDRGSQYCSKDYQEALKNYRMICSMSRKGNCWDNACAETFFSTIKSERIRNKVYKTHEEARRDIFWYIECFYNRRRRHQALGNITPEAFKQLYYKSLASQTKELVA